jgi:hypothetical protein
MCHVDMHLPLLQLQCHATLFAWMCVRCIRLTAAVLLRRMDVARASAAAMNSSQAWRTVAMAAIELLDVHLAIAAFRQACLQSAHAPMHAAVRLCIVAQCQTASTWPSKSLLPELGLSPQLHLLVLCSDAASTTCGV